MKKILSLLGAVFLSASSFSAITSQTMIKNNDNQLDSHSLPWDDVKVEANNYIKSFLNKETNQAFTKLTSEESYDNDFLMFAENKIDSYIDFLKTKNFDNQEIIDYLLNDSETLINQYQKEIQRNQQVINLFSAELSEDELRTNYFELEGELNTSYHVLLALEGASLIAAGALWGLAPFTFGATVPYAVAASATSVAAITGVEISFQMILNMGFNNFKTTYGEDGGTKEDLERYINSGVRFYNRTGKDVLFGVETALSISTLLFPQAAVGTIAIGVIHYFIERMINNIS